MSLSVKRGTRERSEGPMLQRWVSDRPTRVPSRPPTIAPHHHTGAGPHGLAVQPRRKGPGRPPSSHVRRRAGRRADVTKTVAPTRHHQLLSVRGRLTAPCRCPPTQGCAPVVHQGGFGRALLGDASCHRIGCHRRRGLWRRGGDAAAHQRARRRSAPRRAASTVLELIGRA